MSEEDAISKKIRYQIAHIMRVYGRIPEELAYKLELLTHEWFVKGLIRDKN